MNLRSFTAPLLFLLTLLPCSFAAHHEEQVTFAEYTPAPGFSFLEERFITSSISAEFRRGGDIINRFTTREVLDEEFKVTLLEANRETYALAKARVDFNRSIKVLDKPPAQSTPVDEKSYILWVDGTGMDAIPAEGGAVVTEEETAYLNRDFQDLSELALLPRFMRGRAMKIGDTLNLPVIQAGQMLGFEGGLDVVRFTITLEGTRNYKDEEVAEFSVRSTLKGAVFDGDVDAEVNAIGMLLVNPDTSWPVLFRMVGGMKFNPANQEGRTAQGVGTFVVNTTRTYLN
jgi:hypothetical protein